MKLWQKHARQPNIDSYAITLNFLTKANQEKINLREMKKDVGECVQPSTSKLKTYPVDSIVKNAYKTGSQALFNLNRISTKHEENPLNMAGDSFQFLSAVYKNYSKKIKKKNFEENPLLKNEIKQSPKGEFLL